MKETLFLSEPGIACAAGNNAADFWRSLTTGSQDGLVKVKTHSGREFYAAKIREGTLKKTSARYDMRVIQIEDAALEQIAPAVQAAKQKYGAARIAICVGCCDNGSEFSVAGHREYFEKGAFPKNYSLEIQGADYPATYIKEKFGLAGPAYVFATACSSSGSAMIKAAQLVQVGIVDAAICGGVDMASDTVLLGFDSLEAVSETKTNPFSAARSGITLGEGAAFFLLSKDKDLAGASCGGGMSTAPGTKTGLGSPAAPIALLGWGESADASHMTAPLADGSGAFRAMKEALASAGLDKSQIDYINLHGQGHILANYYNKGRFSMYGTYHVEDGIYKLSLQDVIRKDFQFQSGSTITFGGNAQQASLNLKATYTVPNVSMDDLSATTLGLSNTRVDCVMNIGGRPLAPVVTFDFDLPQANEDEKNMVRQMINTEEERNMQVIYLLGIGRFYNQSMQYVSAADQSKTAMNSLLSSTLSNQFNQIMSNMLGTNNWSFGANLRTGETGWDQTDVEGILSGRLLNNRLLINGNFGYRESYYTTNNFIGDFDVRYLLTPSGSVALKAYNQTNDRYFIQSSLTTQGIGLQFKKDFNRWRELLPKKKRKKHAATPLP